MPMESLSLLPDAKAANLKLPSEVPPMVMELGQDYPVRQQSPTLQEDTWDRQISCLSKGSAISEWSRFMGNQIGDTLTFAILDKELIRERVKQHLFRPKYDVQDYYKTKGCSQALVKNPRFEYLTLFVIAVNALWIMVDTDFNKADLLLEAHPIFQVVENLFCFFFSFELTMRFSAFKRKFDAFRDSWFCFDSVLVFVMVLETWIMTAVIGLSGAGSTSGMGNASVLRIARLLRLSRMTRMARLLRAMPEMMILIKGMISATRSVFFTFVLLIIVTYVFAITFVQLTAGTDFESTHFSSVPDAMYTLLLYGALIDDIARFATEMREGLPNDMGFLVGIFFIYVLLAALTIMNMLIGVLCEVVGGVAATEKESLLVKYVHTKLRKVMQLVDADENDLISKHEFLSILESSDAVRALQDVGVDVVGLVEYADFIFENADLGSPKNQPRTKQLTFESFMETILQLRGSNTATVKDIVDLRKYFKTSIKQINEEVSRIRDCIDGRSKNALKKQFTRSLSRTSLPASKEDISEPRQVSSSSVANSQVDKSPRTCWEEAQSSSDGLTTTSNNVVAAQSLADRHPFAICDQSASREIATAAPEGGRTVEHVNMGELKGKWCSLNSAAMHPISTFTQNPSPKTPISSQNTDSVKLDMSDVFEAVKGHTCEHLSHGSLEQCVGAFGAYGAHAEQLLSAEFEQLRAQVSNFGRSLINCLSEFEKMHHDIKFEVAKIV